MHVTNNSPPSASAQNRALTEPYAHGNRLLIDTSRERGIIELAGQVIPAVFVTINGMRNYRALTFILLITAFFATGYAARIATIAHERSAIRQFSPSPVRTPGVPVATTHLESAGNIDLGPLEVMLTVLRSLREHFVDPITPSDEGRMAREALRAMLASLQDPNTRFLDPDQLKLVSEAMRGQYHGIGAFLAIKKIKAGNIQEEHLILVTPIDDGPAAKAGLRAGDDIVAIDGRDVLPLDPFQRASEVIKEERKKAIDKDVLRKHIESETKRIEEGIPILKAERMLTSEDDKELELTVVRKGTPQPIKVKVKTEAFFVQPVSWKLTDNDQLGYIRLGCFTDRTPDELESAVYGLKSKGAKGIILDLRNTAAGNLETVLSAAKVFIPGRVFAIEHKSRNRKVPIRVEQYPRDRVWNGPMVVLVNSGTARMAEALAVALKDNIAAKIVGEPSYGDPSSVTLMELRDGSGIAMTTGKLVPLRSPDYHGKGLHPDILVASNAQRDEQLNEATKLLRSMTRSLVSTQSGT